MGRLVGNLLQSQQGLSGSLVFLQISHTLQQQGGEVWELTSMTAQTHNCVNMAPPPHTLLGKYCFVYRRRCITPPWMISCLGSTKTMCLSGKQHQQIENLSQNCIWHQGFVFGERSGGTLKREMKTHRILWDSSSSPVLWRGSGTLFATFPLKKPCWAQPNKRELG